MSLLAVEVYQNAVRDQPGVHANYLDVASYGQLAEAATVTCMGGVVATSVTCT
jgi:hypothetical protein